MTRATTDDVGFEPLRVPLLDLELDQRASRPRPRDVGLGAGRAGE